MFDVAMWLVRGGCTLMMAWGLDGSAWDDAGDWAYLTYNNFDDPPESEWFMMTTWHDDEQLNEVFDMAVNWTGSHTDLAIEHRIVLHVAARSDQERIMALLLAPLEE